MNKQIIVIIVLIILILAAAFINYNSWKEPSPEVTVVPTQPASKPIETDNLVEVTKDIHDKIMEDANIDVLVQIQTFDMLNVNYEPLLEAAMRLATNLGLVEYEMSDMYIEYVPRSVVHEIIFELSGIMIKDPIVIEDFYYLYDEEHDYYYVVPVGVSWMQLNSVDSISYSKSDAYIVKCNCSIGTEDYGVKIDYPDVELVLKYKPTNKYVKYQLISIDAGSSKME